MAYTICKQQDPYEFDVWYPVYSGPRNQDVRSLVVWPLGLGPPHGLDGQQLRGAGEGIAARGGGLPKAPWLFRDVALIIIGRGAMIEITKGEP